MTALREEHWRARIARCNRQRRDETTMLADALRAALGDRSAGYFSLRELRDLYGGPPVTRAALICQLVPSLVAARIGLGVQVSYVRAYRERRAGVEVTR